MKTFLRLTPLLSVLFYASKQLIAQAPPIMLYLLIELPLRISDEIARRLEILAMSWQIIECFHRRQYHMFTDILIVSILTPVWFETLMRPICQL